jgi:hypothetical protein
MSLFLALLPLTGTARLCDMMVHCHDRLTFDQDYFIFDQLPHPGHPHQSTVKAITIPPQLWVETYREGGVERTRKDRYGVDLTFVFAEDLKGLKISDDTSFKNKAIKAFVDTLPDEIPIILMWS